MAVSSGTPLPPVIAGPYRVVRRVLDALLGMLDDLGAQLSFYARSFGWTWRVLLRYKREVVRLLAEVALGSGALALVGGTIGVIAFLTFFTGTEVGLQGYAALNQLGTANFTAFLSAYFNTREIAPLVAGLALSATVGCGFTAQLGAMRISEVVYAHGAELPFLVTTRMIAGFIAVVPLYVVGLLSSYFAARTITTGFYKQSTGTYDQYFHQYLPPIDVVYSFVKVLIFALIVILIHCYYGYYASGGPAGVGVAVGRAVRTAIVAINLVDFFLSLAIWGATTTVRIAG